MNDTISKGYIWLLKLYIKEIKNSKKSGKN